MTTVGLPDSAVRESREPVSTMGTGVDSCLTPNATIVLVFGLINIRTANALGLTMPPSLLLRADQIIQ